MEKALSQWQQQQQQHRFTIFNPDNRSPGECYKEILGKSAHHNNNSTNNSNNNNKVAAAWAGRKTIFRTTDAIGLKRKSNLCYSIGSIFTYRPPRTPTHSIRLDMDDLFEG